MSNNAQSEFMSNAKKEINQRIKTETKALSELNNEKNELIEAIEGYENYYKEIECFFIDVANDFNIKIDELPNYFKSNINDVYQNYVKIKSDALNEISTLTKYIEHCKREVNNSQRTLKFYRSQYYDSDFFDECLPLVQLYQDKIDIYNENIKLTEKTIEKLKKIVEKLEKWN